VHTALSTRRVLVTDYVEGLGTQAIARLSEAERDRVGELAFRFYFGLAWRDGVVAGDPHPDHCLLCPDGRVCLLDLGLVRELEPDRVAGERAVMQAIADGDAQRLHDGLSRLSYLPDPGAVDPDALLEHLATAGRWLLAPGFRRLGPEDVERTVALGHPPRSPWFGQMRRLSLPAPRGRGLLRAPRPLRAARPAPFHGRDRVVAALGRPLGRADTGWRPTSARRPPCPPPPTRTAGRAAPATSPRMWPSS
jgi:hypothetical protein